MIKNIMILLLRLYQIAISPLFSGNCCRFQPSCSQFAILAIKKYGLAKGSWLMVKRILKCGFWHSSKEHCLFLDDPVPSSLLTPKLNMKKNINDTKLRIVILAGGNGSRLNFDKNKPFLTINNQSILEHVIQAAIPLKADDLTIVINKQCISYKSTLNHYAQYFPHGIHYTTQEQALGTGHATKLAFDDMQISQNEIILVLLGDTIINTNDLFLIVEQTTTQNANLLIAGIDLAEPKHFGRIVMEQNQTKVQKIVEWKEANQKEKEITICNSGIICGKGTKLQQYVNLIEKGTKEYYLTDCVIIANKMNDTCEMITLKNKQLLGINTMEELQKCRNYFQTNIDETQLLHSPNVKTSKIS